MVGSIGKDSPIDIGHQRETCVKAEESDLVVHSRRSSLFDRLMFIEKLQHPCCGIYPCHHKDFGLRETRSIGTNAGYTIASCGDMIACEGGL